MSKRILLSEVARFQSIAGLRSINTLREEMGMEEDSDYMGAETIEDEPVTEGIWDTALGQIGTLVGLVGGVTAVGKLLLVYSANQIKNKNPEMSEEEAKAKAKAELQQGMESSMGQSAGTGHGGNA